MGDGISSYGISLADMVRIYEAVKESGESGVGREDFLQLIRPLKRSVESLLKMMECNGFLLYEDCNEFRVYVFSIEMIERMEEEELKKLRIQHYANTRNNQSDCSRRSSEKGESVGTEDSRS